MKQMTQMTLSNFSVAYWKKLFSVTRQAFFQFFEDKCFKLSAALAYYTIFSIGPLLLILIWILGFLYGEHLENTTAKQEVLNELTKIFDRQFAIQIQAALENLAVSTNSKIGIIVGVSTLIFTSTTLFVEIQDSINMIWGVKPKPKKSWLKFLTDRATSFSMILGLGFLLIASLVINSVILILTNYFNEIITGVPNQLLKNLNNLLTFFIIVSIFGFIFKVLPDAKVQNRDIVGGALFTGLLFMLGRYGISIYLQYNATANAFGAAGSIIILLLWIYYSAAILYFGAEFTKEHAKMFNRGIHPADFAVLIEKNEIEIDDSTTSDS